MRLEPLISKTSRRQAQRDRGNIGRQRQGYEDGGVEGQDAAHHLLHLHPADGAADEEAASHRRRRQPHAQIHRGPAAYPELNRVHAELLHQRQEVGVQIRFQAAMSMMQPRKSSTRLIGRG